jgi:hypothetical protein
LGVSVLNEDVLAHDIAQRTKTLLKHLMLGRMNGWRLGAKHPKYGNLLCRLLRLAYDRKSEHYHCDQD